MSTALSNVKANDLAVSYEVLGEQVSFDLDFVKRYLVRGEGKYITDQEAVLFMNTCKMMKLNPLVGSEVYLIKYSDRNPAQIVVGKDAYLRKAFDNPDYLGKVDGITVLRGDQIFQKEGICLYPNEKLIGGWCRVSYLRGGKERTAFREVSLEEYGNGMSTWKSKPATMINKVAISQCIRDAFPKDYEGMYSEEEMIAAGAIPSDVIDNSEVIAGNIDTVITNEERRELFKLAKELLGDKVNDVLKSLISEKGYSSTTELKKSELESIKREILDIAKSLVVEDSESSNE